MISLDGSIVPAILIFILTIVALNYLLFRPVTRVQAERESRTTGLMTQTRHDLDHQMRLFDQYQATIKNARLEGYRLAEQARSNALLQRNQAMNGARESAEQMTQAARGSVHAQVVSAKARLEGDAHAMAGSIALAILRRPA